jgi:hypothetical protein
MLVELRGTKGDGTAGWNTRVPPSIHQCGEIISYDREENPSLVEASALRKSVAQLASAALLARHWPAKSEGRHDCMLALAGTLAAAKCTEEEALSFATAMYRSIPTHDRAAIKRVTAEVRTTYNKLSRGKAATGIPRLKELLGDKIVDTLLQWLAGDAKADRENRIVVSDLLHVAVEKAEQLLAASRGHKLYARGSQLVRVVEEQRDFKVEAPFRRPKGNTYLATADATCLEFILSKTGCVFAWDGEKKEYYATDPRKKWCDHIVARMASAPDLVPWNWLNSITNIPLLLADGSLIEEPGYHAATGVWFDPQEYKFPKIPKQPSQQEARAALNRFDAVFGEFSFATEKDQAWNASPSYAAVLATILSVLLRHLVPTVPLLAITAPEPGSGKTKIAEAIGRATTGCLLSRISYDKTEEFNKQLPIPLAAADRIVLIDNVDRKMVNSARLSMALSTEAAIKWRILGETREQTILNRSVFIATGNHLIISGDLPRRSLLCRLTPDSAAPEAREFNFDPVTRAREQFPNLAMAGLTAARYYLQKNCPAPDYKKVPNESGSFTHWNRIVRGLLVDLGFGDPLATQQEVRAENPLLENDIELAQALHKLFPSAKKFSAKEIHNATGTDAFNLLLGAEQRWDAQNVGYRLRGLRDRILDGLKVEGMGHTHGSAFYRVTPVRKGGVG